MTAGTRGFTLIELLVALAVFAVLATLAFGGLNEAVIQSERLDASQKRWAEVQRAVRILENDIVQARARPVRSILGRDHEPALRAARAGGMELTRGGWLNPALHPRAELQRVRYRLLEDRLVREYWPVLDRIGATAAAGEVVLTGVTEFRLEFLPATDSGPGNWTGSWPPPGETSQEPLPLGVRLTLALSELGRISRLIEVRG